MTWKKSSPVLVFRPGFGVPHEWYEAEAFYDDGEKALHVQVGMTFDSTKKRGIRRCRNFKRWFRGAMKGGAS